MLSNQIKYLKKLFVGTLFLLTYYRPFQYFICLCILILPIIVFEPSMNSIDVNYIMFQTLCLLPTLILMYTRTKSFKRGYRKHYAV